MGVANGSLVAMTTVFALLGGASLTVGVLNKRVLKHNYEEIVLRLRSWWIIALLLFGSLFLGRTTAIVFFGLISFLALKEFLSIVGGYTRVRDRCIMMWCYVCVPIQYYWVAQDAKGLFLAFVPMGMFLLLPVRSVMLGETRGYLSSCSVIFWGGMHTIYSLSHLAYLYNIPQAVNPAAGATGLILFLVVLTQWNDISQYLWGKPFGQRKILPKVSPSKTWVGFLGGAFNTAAAAAWCGPYLTNLSVRQSLGAGLVIAIGGFAGDVVFSAVKRDLGIKDYSQFIPGHGGVLDRLDSLTYTAPLFVHFLWIQNGGFY